MLGHAPLSAAPLSAFVVVDSGVVVKIAGVTKNMCGVPEPGCTVKLFRTATDTFVASTVSNGVGYYEFLNPVGAPFYAVAYKAGATDIVGTTKNTLIPA